MTTVALARKAPCGDLTPEEFREALCQLLPGSRPSEAFSVSLVALLDDASLATLVAVGPDHGDSRRRLVWSDEAWADLLQGLHDSARPPDGRHRTLIPVMLGPILYGVIDWRGPCLPDALPGDVVERASEAFLPPLINRIHG